MMACAIATIALTLGIGMLLPPPKQDYFEQARDAIVSAIGAAEVNKSPTAFLPPKGLAYFDRLGRSLLDDEAIEFPTETSDRPAADETDAAAPAQGSGGHRADRGDPHPRRGS